MTSTLHRRLRDASDRLDALLRETACPIRNTRRYDELEAEAQAIAGEVRAAFREAGVR